MGFLDIGETMTWEEVVEVIDYVKRHGLKQLVHAYTAAKPRSLDSLKWGDEVEYMVLHWDHAGRRVRLALRGETLLEELGREEKEALGAGRGLEGVGALWRPEYGRFMIEGTPGVPYGGTVQDLLLVLPSMSLRRAQVRALLRPDESIVSLTHFPLMGVADFTQPYYPPGGPITHSIFVPDQIINSHPRFGTLTRNIRLRKGRKVAINVPVFMDLLTRVPLGEDERQLPGHIYCDAMAFGMGSSCVQCTFQCCNLDEARNFYDALVPLAPVMLALTANCPIVRGYLVDTDCRWNIIAASVDSRRDEEQAGLACLHETKPAPFVDKLPPRRTGEVIGESGGSFYGCQKKSRYDSVSLYIGTNRNFDPKYNDVNVRENDWVRERLLKAGFDAPLARHFAHLFIQDPLVIYKGKLKMDDTTHMDHFENIQSTNWQTVRFKPPPPNSNIGWRVEFRSMELQFHDFENAAYVIFVALMTRVLMQFRLNLYMPISKVDVNMARAQVRDSVLNQKFYWRKHTVASAAVPAAAQASDADAVVELTAAEILNGTTDAAKGAFPGCIPLIRRYLNTKLTAPEVIEKIEVYLDFLSKRASGELMTGAAWQRQFVRNHPAYRRDSIVTPDICYDLLKEIDRIESLSSEDATEIYRKKATNQ